MSDLDPRDPRTERVVARMKKAIDRAAQQTQGKAEWEDIFGSQELTEYCLDDRNLDKGGVQ
jgi:hypothetical protein